MFAAVMHLSRWRRVSAAVLALWIGGLPAESLALRSCPMHELAPASPVATATDGVASHAAPESPAPQAPHESRNGAHAAHSPSSHAAHLTHASQSGDGERSLPSPCNCLGLCLGAGVVAVAVPRIGVAAAREVLVARMAVSAQRAVPSDAPHRLPFAIPPPLAEPAA